jgi:hypothetical protein
VLRERNSNVETITLSVAGTRHDGGCRHDATMLAALETTGKSEHGRRQATEMQTSAINLRGD